MSLIVGLLGIWALVWVLDVIKIAVPMAIIILIVSKVFKTIKYNKDKDNQDNEYYEFVSNANSEGLSRYETSLNLYDGEYCYYNCDAAHVITKKMNTGSKRNGRTSKITWMKGYSVYNNNSGTQSIRGTVEDVYYGNLQVTNKRIVFLGDKSFDIDMDKLYQYTIDNGDLMLQVKGKAYRVRSRYARQISIVLKMLNTNE